jgi:hypothetical protein
MLTHHALKMLKRRTGLAKKKSPGSGLPGQVVSDLRRSEAGRRGWQRLWLA